MMYRKWPILLASLIFVFALSAQSGAAAQETAPLAAPAATQSAPESGTDIASGQEADGRLLISVMIADNGPYSFILDTAAERTIIARELATELNLPSRGAARILSLTSTREFGTVTIPELSIMPNETQTLRAFAIARRNVGADGIIGLDVLKDRRVVFDMSASEIRVIASTRPIRQRTASEIVVRARRRFGQLVLADADVGGRAIDVIIDSGANVSIGNTALRDLLVRRNTPIQTISIVSITGEDFPADYSLVNAIRIGGLRVEGLPIAFANPHFFRRMNMTDRPALLLGMDALELFENVVVDFRRRRVKFTLPE